MDWSSDNDDDDVYGGGSQLANRTVMGNNAVDAAHPQVVYRAGAENRSRGGPKSVVLSSTIEKFTMVKKTVIK